MKTIKQFKDLRIVKLDKAIYGGLYSVVDDKLQEAKTGLCLGAAIELFNIHKNNIMKVNRTISEQTICKVLVSLKQFGTMGKSVSSFSINEKRYVVNEMDKRGWIQPNSLMLTEKGSRESQKYFSIYSK